MSVELICYFSDLPPIERSKSNYSPESFAILIKLCTVRLLVSLFAGRLLTDDSYLSSETIVEFRC